MCNQEIRTSRNIILEDSIWKYLDYFCMINAENNVLLRFGLNVAEGKTYKIG